MLGISLMWLIFTAPFCGNICTNSLLRVCLRRVAPTGLGGWPKKSCAIDGHVSHMALSMGQSQFFCWLLLSASTVSAKKLCHVHHPHSRRPNHTKAKHDDPPMGMFVASEHETPGHEHQTGRQLGAQSL